MKSFIVFALFVAAAAALPVSNDKDATIVSLVNDNIGVDGFKSGYETSNGISATAEGQLVQVDAENAAVAVRGQFSYPGPDGVIYTVTYIADQNGFQPSAAHLPVSPK